MMLLFLKKGGAELASAILILCVRWFCDSCRRSVRSCEQSSQKASVRNKLHHIPPSPSYMSVSYTNVSTCKSAGLGPIEIQLNLFLGCFANITQTLSNDVHIRSTKPYLFHFNSGLHSEISNIPSVFSLDKVKKLLHSFNLFYALLF